MMAQVMFDTLGYAKDLQAGGVPREQAEAQAKPMAQALTGWMHNQLATKKDIYRLDHKIDVVKKDLLIKLGGMIGGSVAFLATFLSSLMVILH